MGKTARTEQNFGLTATLAEYSQKKLITLPKAI